MRNSHQKKCLATSKPKNNTNRNEDAADAMSRRVHALQSEYELAIPANQPYVIRLDGVAFRNYTAGMKKPFDERLTRAMILTTRDLLERCVARTGYTQSDEISLVFAGEPTAQQIMYGGRVQKIVSVLAALAAARFNWHVARQRWKDDDSSSLLGRVNNSCALFDARIFAAPTDIMAGEAIYWRHAYDGRRNAINMVGNAYLSHQEMQGKSLSEVLAQLEGHQIKPFQDYSPSAMLGVLLKKRNFPHVGFNPMTGQSVPTLRARLEARSFDWSHMEELARTQMLLARVWEDHHPASLELIDLDS